MAVNNEYQTCHRVFLTPDQLESHSGTHEQCEQCDKKVISKIALENHINETRMGKILKVTSKGWYQREATDGNLTRNFYCEICTMSFGTVAEVEAHVKTQHMKEYEILKNIQEISDNKHRTSYKCVICDKTEIPVEFGDMKSAVDHVKNNHVDKSEHEMESNDKNSKENSVKNVCKNTEN